VDLRSLASDEIETDACMNYAGTGLLLYFVLQQDLATSSGTTDRSLQAFSRLLQFVVCVIRLFLIKSQKNMFFVPTRVLWTPSASQGRL
jgi:hypothetical protein